MFPTRTLFKILREKLLIQNSHSNGHLTSFDVLITTHVIRPNSRTFCWLCSSENELKNFSRVQRRKYDTIVNIKEKRYANNKLHNVSNSIKIFQGINESRSIILSWPYTRLYIGSQIVSGNFSLHLLKHCRKVKSRKYCGINHYN